MALGTKDYHDIIESNGRFTVKSERSSRPIRNVSWYGATAYAVWLSTKTGRSYRLPTEAEWEFSARGGQFFKFAGSDNLTDVAWCSSNSGSATHNVGERQGNGFGLYDMTGNVWEWCSDWYGYDENYYENSPTQNPKGTQSGSSRVLRGGSWAEDNDDCRSTIRGSYVPNVRDYFVGFRLVRD